MMKVGAASADGVEGGMRFDIKKKLEMGTSDQFKLRYKWEKNGKLRWIQEPKNRWGSTEN